MLVNYRDIVRNIMAREKVLYEGHAVAAVAATSVEQYRPQSARSLIEVDYEILPHVIDVMEAIKPDAPILHDDMFTATGVEPPPTEASNVSKPRRVRTRRRGGGLRRAGRSWSSSATFDTRPVHQAYIEPHACVASVSEDGQAELWCTHPGPLRRAHPLCAGSWAWTSPKLRVTASEIGGGFGGKTVVYLEPVALGAVAQVRHRPVKMVR